MKRFFPIALAAALASLWAGWLYFRDESPAPTLQELAVGQMAGFEIFGEARDLPGTPFFDRAGNAYRLDDFRGTATLLNVWATWCEPCREEMPTLAALAREMEGENFQVVTLSIDWKGYHVIDPFLEEVGTSGLPAYWDKSNRLAAELEAKGLPLTILISREGKWIGRLDGPAEWNSPEALRLMRAAAGG